MAAVIGTVEEARRLAEEKAGRAMARSVAVTFASDSDQSV